MRISLSVWDMTSPDLVSLAMAAERLGFHGLWLGDHVLAPARYRSTHPTTGRSAHQHHAGTAIIDPRTELVDPLVALAAVASQTQKLSLATGVFVLPLRHPLMVARSAMTLQDLADGRFRLGIGVGWLQEEFEALDQAFSGRGARMEEQLEILVAACRGGIFEHHGTHYDIAPVQLSPRTVQVPLVFGGSSPRALRRAAHMASGWFASGTPDVSEVANHRTEILRLRAEAGIDAPISFIARCPTSDLDTVQAYARTGFDEVVLWADQVWTGSTREERDQALAAHAHELELTP